MQKDIVCPVTTARICELLFSEIPLHQFTTSTLQEVLIPIPLVMC